MSRQLIRYECKLFLICVNLWLNELVHSRADESAGNKTSYAARRARVRIFAEGIHAVLRAEKQVERGGLREGTEGAGAGPRRGGVRAI